MPFSRGVKLSANRRIDLWSRWKAGHSLHEIGRAFGKDHVSIQFMLSQHGGIVPAVRRRSVVTLTLAEAESPISALVPASEQGLASRYKVLHSMVRIPPSPPSIWRSFLSPSFWSKLRCKGFEGKK
jgi:hypothetical protein